MTIEYVAGHLSDRVRTNQDYTIATRAIDMTKLWFPGGGASYKRLTDKLKGKAFAYRVAEEKRLDEMDEKSTARWRSRFTPPTNFDIHA